MDPARSAVLHTGKLIPLVGLGTWQSAPGEVAAAVKIALRNGYHHIDCAPIYGNEKEIGEVFGELIGNEIKREDVFVTSKLFPANFHPDDTRKAFLQTLSDLQLSYLDLFIIHGPSPFERGATTIPVNADGTTRWGTNTYLDAYHEMEKLVDEGLVRHIGVSNFSIAQIQKVLDNSRIKPAVNQCECHPYLREWEMINFLKKNGIRFEAYSPLGSPATSGLWDSTGLPKVLSEPVLNRLAEKYGKNVGQICIKYQVQRGVVVLPKSIRESRIIGNSQVFDFELSAEDVASIEALPTDIRYLAALNYGPDGKKIPRSKMHPDHPYYDFYGEKFGVRPS